MSKRRTFVVMFATALAAVGVVPMTGPDGIATAAVTNAVAVGDLTLVETDVGAANVKVPFVLSTPAQAAIAVKYTVSAGTASSPSDFKAKSGTAKFKVGALEQGVAIKVNADTAVEANETFNVTVTSVSGAGVADAGGVVTLTDNDANGVASTPEVTAGRPAVREGSGGDRKTQVPVRLSRPPAGPVTVRFGTGCDVQNVKFKAGQVSRNIGVPITGDFSPNGDYTIPNTVQAAAGAVTVATPNTGVLVRDDDGSAQAVGSTIRASETAAGIQSQYPQWACGEDKSRASFASISADGRYVAFESNATNLVPGDTNGAIDVFLKDLWTGSIERASANVSPQESNLNSKISPDGRYVIYDRFTFNQWPHIWGWRDVYLYDRVTKATEMLLPGVQTETEVHNSWFATISADNRYVAFVSSLPLDGDTDPPCPGDPTCVLSDVFVRDRVTGTTRLLTTGVGGTPTLGGYPVISADGTSVAFTALNGVWVADRGGNTVEQVTVSSAEQAMVGWGTGNDRASISANGRRIAFTVEACNLGVPCPEGPDRRYRMHVYVRDRDAGTTTPSTYTGSAAHVTLSDGVSISGDGRYVTFATDDPNIVPGWSPLCAGKTMVVQRDLLTRAPVRVSAARSGACPNAPADISWQGSSSSSANGSFVVYSSTASDIVTRDRGVDEDVFVRRLR